MRLVSFDRINSDTYTLIGIIWINPDHVSYVASNDEFTTWLKVNSHRKNDEFLLNCPVNEVIDALVSKPPSSDRIPETACEVDTASMQT